MTHFIFGTRGIYASVQQMIQDLNAQRFWWRRKDLNEYLPNGKPNPNFNKIIDNRVQLILRPIQLWEVVYPKESPINPGDPKSEMEDNTQIIMRSLDIKDENHYIPKSIGKYVKFVGKMLGLKPIPELKDPLGTIREVHLVGNSIIPIGIKEDEYKVHDFGIAGKYLQEGL